MIDSFIINVLKINDSVSDLPLSLLKKAISLNHTEVGYYTGYLLFEVVQMVFPVGLIIKGATSAAKVSKFGRLFKLEDKLSDLNRAAQNFETKKSQKSIVHAGISKTEIQAFLDFLKILSEKLRKGTEGFVEWLREIFEEFKQWVKELFGNGKKVGAPNIRDLKKTYGKLVQKGESKLKKQYSIELKKLLKESDSPTSKKKFEQDFLKKKPKPKNKETYLKRRKQAFINFEKGDLFEKKFENLFGGLKPDASIKTAFTHRFIDNVKGNVARELKSGYVKMSREFRKQIKKDIDIIGRELSSTISKIEWHIIDGIDSNCLTYIQELAKEKKVLDKITIILY